ncbi:phage scaffolding protein [Enterococcus faecium]|uniref:phage scaffolding protein n=1 Tax=Enterococcus faecium TaxID=1352 RepID=UPI001A0D562A|nr:phage scaffolding protein [Enterococcus faecium]EGP4758753.1 capsid protein [Enterococcus faecium]EGP5416320.1 capsid protein [Enterococcus faecium]UQQ78733.1 phage scaffolding protein [Enterococcus faecium]HCD7931535.1 phage scaffolding protein [Enterococcus faecium]
MKREQLKDLGLTDEQVNSVMGMHGQTVTELNKNLATAEQERDQFKEQLDSNQTELDALKESAKGDEELTQQLADLQSKFDAVKSDSETKLAEQQKDFAIKLALKEANALDEEIVLGQLDKDTIKVVDGKLQGFEEQLKGLQESKSFLFQEAKDPEPTPPTPTIVTPGNPAGSITPSYDLAKMSYQEVAKLKQEQPEVFKQLTQQ